LLRRCFGCIPLATQVSVCLLCWIIAIEGFAGHGFRKDGSKTEMIETDFSKNASGGQELYFGCFEREILAVTI
jgi:hypothetical protein